MEVYLLQVFQQHLRCVFEVNGGVERPAQLRHLSSGVTEIVCHPVLVSTSSDSWRAATNILKSKLKLIFTVADATYSPIHCCHSASCVTYLML